MSGHHFSKIGISFRLGFNNKGRSLREELVMSVRLEAIRFYGSDFCWFRKLDRVNTLKMTFRHTDPQF